MSKETYSVDSSGLLNNRGWCESSSGSNESGCDGEFHDYFLSWYGIMRKQKMFLFPVSKLQFLRQ